MKANTLWLNKQHSYFGTQKLSKDNVPVAVFVSDNDVIPASGFAEQK